MRISQPIAPACSKVTNCRSVARSAASGMLLNTPIERRGRKDCVCSPPSAVSNLYCATAVIASFCGFCSHEPALGRRQRLVDVGDDVIDVLDADAEADRFWINAGRLLLVRRHLAMRCRGRMASERFRVTDIDQPLHHPQ